MILGNALSRCRHSFCCARALVVILALVALSPLLAFSSAQAATVTTDRTDYPPGDTVLISGTGFMAGETVEVQVTHDDGTPLGGLGHDPWDVVADGSGNIATSWYIPLDDNLDELLKVRATGQTSAEEAFAYFADASTILTLETAIPDSICPGDGAETIEVCATLEQHCQGGSYAALEGRELIFFFNAGNCGVNVGQNGEDTVLTDANGLACGNLTIPTTPGQYAIRVKFLGESKPGSGDPPNSACDTTDRVQLSAANVCEIVTVDSVICNEPPVCEVPNDTTIFQCSAEEICLNAGATDPDGDPVTCTIIDGPGALVAGQWCWSPTAPFFDSTFSVTIECEDDNGAFCEATFNITYVKNHQPVCVVVEDTTIFQCTPEEVCLQVICTDEDNNLLPDVPFLASGPGTIVNNLWCYTPTGNEVDTIVWRCRDSCFAVWIDTFIVTFEVNEAPVCDLPADTTIFQCAPAEVCLPVSASDADGNLTGCAITAGLGSLTGGNWCYTPTGNETVNVTITCTDDCGATCEGSFAVTFVMNEAPVCDLPSDTTIFQCAPAEVCLPVSASDADGNLANCAITVGPGSLTGGNWCYTPTGDETVNVTITCTDDCGASCSGSFAVTFDVNEAPVCDLPTDTTIFQCAPAPVCLPVSATDVDGNLANCAITAGPGSLTGGNWCYTPTGNETVNVTITCTDDCGATCSGSFAVTFDINEGPVCDLPPLDTTIFQCTPTQVCLPVGATDADGNLAGCTITAGPGTLSGGNWCYTPTGDETVNVTITCIDDCGASCGGSFSVTFDMNEAPVCNIPADDIIEQCTPTEICLPVSATDADGNLTGCTIVSGPGTLSGGNWCYTPTGDEIVAVTIRCTDDCGASCEDTFTLTINVNDAPVCDLPADTSIFLCEPSQVCLPVSATDPNGDPVTCSVVSGPGVVSGGNWCYTPSGSETVNVTISCEDDCGASCEGSFTVDFAINSAPVCSVPQDQTIFQCEPTEVCLPVSATDVDGNLTGCTIVSGPGTLSGGNWCYTPTGSGDVTVTIRCTDDCGASCETSFTITFDMNDAPVCDLPTGQADIFLCDIAEICLPASATDPDGNLTGCTVVNGPGAIVNGNWCYTPAGSELVNVTISCVDECGASCEGSFSVNITINSAPVCTVPANQDIFQCEPTEVCLPVSCDDADGNLLAGSPTLVSGPGAIVNGEWCYTPAGDESHTVTIRCEDECGAFCESSFDVTFAMNQSPTVTSCPSDATIHWGDQYVDNVTATDPEGGPLSYTMCPNSPIGMTVSQTGEITWQTDFGDICVTTACVIVLDTCGGMDVCEFTICVQNTAPIIACGDDQTICSGDIASGSVTASDPDGGPYDLRYSLASFDGPGTVVVDSLTGDWVWETVDDPNFTGLFEVCIEVNDGAEICDPCNSTNSSVCCASVLVIPAYNVYIEKVHGPSGLGVIQGQIVDVRVYLDNEYSVYDMGGFDFLIQYDQSALTFLGATEGGLIVDCDWEYFTYRFGVSGNCGGNACPAGVLRVVAIAETNNGAYHPSCFTNESSNELTVLHFLVSDDRTLECSFAPIRWIWYDCADNGISTPTGDTLVMSRWVYEYRGENGEDTWYEVTGYSDGTLPSNYGAPSPLCDESDKTEPLRCADFYGGGVDIICSDSIDAPGDINLNGVAYEIADAVMLTNFFVEGLSAFEYADGSIAASDVNKDGITLSVADLVYLIRVVVGDALPYAKGEANGLYAHSGDMVSVIGDLDVGGAHLVIDGEVEPVLLVDGMEMRSRFDGVVTRIIIHPSMGTESSPVSTTASFSGDFLAGIEGEILSIEMATPWGARIEASGVPTTFELGQNYPNPFNPSTTIKFSLTKPSEVRLDVYNVVGQLVTSLADGWYEVGYHSVEWDARTADGLSVASGVYFYRLETAEHSLTRKMILLK